MNKREKCLLIIAFVTFVVFFVITPIALHNTVEEYDKKDYKIAKNENGLAYIDLKHAGELRLFQSPNNNDEVGASLYGRTLKDGKSEGEKSLILKEGGKISLNQDQGIYTIEGYVKLKEINETYFVIDIDIEGKMNYYKNIALALLAVLIVWIPCYFIFMVVGFIKDDEKENGKDNEDEKKSLSK